MKQEDYKNKCNELQSSVVNVFEQIKSTSCPELSNTEWYLGQCHKLAECLEELGRIHSEFRHLQAEQYDLLVPEDQPEKIDFDPSKYEEIEPQQEIQDPATQIATAVAGVGAIINLFRKARG